MNCISPVEYRPATGNRSSDSPTAYAQHCAVVAGKRHHRATVAPDWMSIPCGFMACDAQRVICRIDECRGWSAGLALAPVMFRAQLNEQDLPLSLTVVGIAPEKLSAWAGADAERLTVTALPAITTYGEPEGNLLTGPWQPRVSYRKQWARWRVMILRYC